MLKRKCFFFTKPAVSGFSYSESNYINKGSFANDAIDSAILLVAVASICNL